MQDNRTLYLVVPVYNVEAYLRRCVDSLLSQTYPNLKIILVDDGATDRSGAICDELVAEREGKTPALAVIHQPNGGLSAARNTGLEYCLADGTPEDCVVFIDSDDFVTPNFAERLMALAREYGADAVQCAYEKGEGDAFTAPVGAPGAVRAVTAREALLGYMLKSQTTPKLFRLSLFDGLRFTRGVLNEDEFITYKLIWRAGRVVFADDRLYYYYQRQSGIMGGVARRLKGSPHRFDWLHAYLERMIFFEEAGEEDLVLRTMEKICTDIILRYTEQMALPPDARDTAVTDGEYLRTYRNFCRRMLRRSGMPPRRRAMYIAFYLWPGSSSLAAKFTALRK